MDFGKPAVVQAVQRLEMLKLNGLHGEIVHISFASECIYGCAFEHYLTS
jgi:hypothetical protein